MAVVAISRKVGSHGEEIAGLVAQRLGYRLVGREQIHHLARQCDAQFQEACALFEQEEGAGGLWERLVFRDPAQTALFAALNLELAAEDRVVLVGRGAQVVLQNVPGVFKVRVVAPLNLRVERVMALHGVGLDEARDYVTKHDKARRRLIESVFQRDLSDWSLYDLVINTAAMDKEAAAEVIARGVALMPPVDDEAAHKDWLGRQALAKRMEGAIKKEILTSAFHEVTVDCPAVGQLVLNGVVQDKRGRQRAEQIARRQEPRATVSNLIKTTDLSW